MLKFNKKLLKNVLHKIFLNNNENIYYVPEIIITYTILSIYKQQQLLCSDDAEEMTDGPGYCR